MEEEIDDLIEKSAQKMLEQRLSKIASLVEQLGSLSDTDKIAFFVIFRRQYGDKYYR